MIRLLLLAASAALAGATPEEQLRAALSRVRSANTWELRRAVLGDAADLRDAVANGAGAEKKRLADRLPGMSKEPFALCRDLERCREAPQSLHVEDTALIDEAFVALARPWFHLQKARGKAAGVAVEPGVGVKIELEGLEGLAFVTLEAMPTPTGGFDVSLAQGRGAAERYAAERAAVLQRLP